LYLWLGIYRLYLRVRVATGELEMQQIESGVSELLDGRIEALAGRSQAIDLGYSAFAMALKRVPELLLHVGQVPYRVFKNMSE
jgi:hypothetical protein